MGVETKAVAKRKAGDSDKATILSRAEQKERTRERKRHRVNFDVIDAINKAWTNQVPVKAAEPEDRRKRVSAVINAVGDKLVQVVIKHDVSRVIQSCVKYGSMEQRHQILKLLKGHLLELSCNQYSSHAVLKLVRYGDRDVQKAVVDELAGNCRKLAVHRSGCRVLDLAFRGVGCTAERRNSLLYEFYGNEAAVFLVNADSAPTLPTLLESLGDKPKRHASVLESIRHHLEKTVAKGTASMAIVHRLLLDYLHVVDLNTARTMIESFRENVVELMQSGDGSRALVRMLALATAKDRKSIVKAIKPHVCELAVDADGHLVLIGALDVVDDTVLTTKCVLNELLSNAKLSELLMDQCVCRVLMQVLAPHSTRYFAPDELALLAPPTVADCCTGDRVSVVTSKKSPETRQQELMNAVFPALLKLEIPSQALKARATGELFVELFAAALRHTQYGEEAEKALLQLAERLMAELSVDDSKAVLTDVIGHRIVRNLIAKTGANSQVFAKAMAEQLYSRIENGSADERKAVCESRMAWILCELLESKEGKEETAKLDAVVKLRKLLRNTLKKVKFEQERAGLATLRKLVSA